MSDKIKHKMKGQLKTEGISPVSIVTTKRQNINQTSYSGVPQFQSTTISMPSLYIQ